MSRPVVYPLRPIDTATVRFTAAPHHRRRVTIDHRPLANVTPAMLLDWFSNIGGTTFYGGAVIDRYLAWHPIDHIRWELARPAPGGGAAEGARFRIVEAFGGRPEFKVDVTDRVEKLDETGIRLVQRVAGMMIFQLEHTWSTGVDGAHYVSVMDVGARSPLLAPLNRVLCRRFSDDMLRAWVRHNIEEVGQLEYLLSRPVEDCDGCPALARIRSLGLDDPSADRPDLHCKFGDRRIRAGLAAAACPICHPLTRRADATWEPSS